MEKGARIGSIFVLTAVWYNVHRDGRHIGVFWVNAHLEEKYSLPGFSGILEIEGEGLIDFESGRLHQE